MNSKKVRRKQLPLITALILIASVLFEIFGVYKLSNYICENEIGSKELLAHTNHFVAIMIVIATIILIMIMQLSDVMYNRDSVTQVANSDKMVEFAAKKYFFGSLANYTTIFLNIKDMRTINARFDKSGGDIVMREYALSLKKTLGNNNFICRMGGDNFVVWVKNDMVESFLRYLKGVIINAEIDGVKVTLTIRARAGIYTAKQGDTPHEALNGASIAFTTVRTMQDKEQLWFEPWMAEGTMKRRRIVTDFEHAILEDDFVINYQPKFLIKERKLCGAEALVTWNKGGEIIPPEDFIGVLEQFGMISELDYHMLKTVCRNIKDWERKGLKPVRISVNFSRENLKDPNFAGRVLSIIDEYEVDVRFIEIEITESSPNNMEGALTAFISQMKKRGIKVAVDDFGVGYSALSLIPKMDFDVIKLDKSFLKDIETKRQREFVQGIIKMLNRLDFEVVCEGVEKEEQAEFLEIAGCRVGQGYLFSRNVSEEEFENML